MPATVHGNLAEAGSSKDPKLSTRRILTGRISHLTPYTLAADPNGPDSQGRLSDDVLERPADDEATAGCSRTTKALEIVRVCGSVDSGTPNTGLRIRTSMGHGKVSSWTQMTKESMSQEDGQTQGGLPPGPACLATSAKQENSSYLPCSPLRMVVCGSCTGRVWLRKYRCTCCRRRCTTCWMRECSSSQGSGDFHDGRAAGRHPHPPNPPSIPSPTNSNLPRSIPQTIFRLCGHCTTRTRQPLQC